MLKLKTSAWTALLVILIAITAIPATASPRWRWRDSEVPSEDEIFGWIGDISAMGYRRPGTSVDAQVRKYILDKLVEFGLKDVRDEPIGIDDGFMLWQADEWSLTVEGKEIPCFFIPYTAHTGPEGIKAEIVYVGEEIEEGEDVKGKIVAADIRFADLNTGLLKYFSYFAYDPGNTTVGLVHPATWVRTNFQGYGKLGVYGDAYKAGAVGFVGILKDYPTNTNKYYCPYDGIMKPMPGLWVGRDDGAYLRELLETATEPVYATLKLTGSIDTAATTGNVVGFLPGKTDDIIIISSHHDGPWYSAVEDASGTAEVLAIAKYFGQIPEVFREKTLVFVLQAGHFYGEIGARTFIKDHPDLIEKTMLEISIEHIAKDFDVINGEWVDTGYVEPRGIFTTANPLLVRFAEEAVVEHDLRRTFILQTESPLGVPTDGESYYRAGVPIYNLISGPEYLFDPVDTVDKVAKDQLVPVAKAFIDIINRVDDVPASLIRNSPPVPPPLPPFIAPYSGWGEVYQGYGSMDVDGRYKGKGALYIRPPYIDTMPIWGLSYLVFLGVDGSAWVGPWIIVEQWQDGWVLYKCRDELGRILWVYVYKTSILAVGKGVFFAGCLA
jgi:hypothetical protein